MNKDEGIKLKGIYTFTKAKLETKEQFQLHKRIKQAIKSGKGYMQMVRKLNQMCKTEVLVVQNIIPTVGRTMIANNLTASSPTDTMNINYTAVGTGNTAVANGDTTLATESYRKTTASSTNANNVAYVTAFYDATEVTGTFKEAGLFSNASSTTDSGVLFSRVLLNGGAGIVKSGTETLTIDTTITIS